LIETARLFEESWEELVNNHKKQGRVPIKGWSPEKCFKETGWTWNERDLQAVLFSLLRKHIKKMPFHLDVHLEVELNKDIIGNRKWKEMKENFENVPKVDVICLHMGKRGEEPLDLCAELKYWGYFKTRIPQFRTFRKGWILSDIQKLEKLLELNICSHAYFCYLDEYYCNVPNVREQLMSFLKSKETETGVKCLYGWITIKQFLTYLKKAKIR